MRFGVVGTRLWATAVHGAGIQAATGAELIGFWGRDPAKAAEAAAGFEVTTFDDFDELLDSCDAVSFAVPPFVQAELAVKAAQAGKHLLLEKPIAIDVEDADRLVAAIKSAGVKSAVFVTGLYQPQRRAWAAQMSARAPWTSASLLFLGAAFAPDSPFDTPWRRDKGGLWDVGPHAIAALSQAIGDVTDVAAAAATHHDLTEIVFRHESGALSTATLTISASRAVGRTQLVAWNDDEFVEMPTETEPIQQTFARAVTELVAAVKSGSDHPVDAAYGQRLVALLAKVEDLAGITQQRPAT